MCGLAMTAARTGRPFRLAVAGRRGQSGAMRQLLLLRHAKSSWDDPSVPDFSRPLNARGRAAAGAMRTAVRGLGLAPDQVLVSTARRTLETMEALEPWDDTPLVEQMDQLYLAPAAGLLRAVQEVQPTVRSLLLIGHNPGLHELALLLLGANPDSADAHRLRDGYPSGALAEFTVGTPWAGVAEGGGRLVRFLCPRDLPAGA